MAEASWLPDPLDVQPPPPALAAGFPPPAAHGRTGLHRRKLGELRDAGILTDEEFAAQKAKILGA